MQEGPRGPSGGEERSSLQYKLRGDTGRGAGTPRVSDAKLVLSMRTEGQENPEVQPELLAQAETPSVEERAGIQKAQHHLQGTGLWKRWWKLQERGLVERGSGGKQQSLNAWELEP